MIALRPADPAYPARLRDHPSPPDPLYLSGDPAVLSRDAIAIVGTRRMTAYGERVARELATAAAFAGCVVVSGLAVGIDSAAHAGALVARGVTVAVLGEGIDAFAPNGRRRRLAARIREHGALVSEYPPLFAAHPWSFARRNMTIAALVSAVVVVEAPIASGALITARAARSLGRDVYAVPGPLGSFASAGANALIASGEARALLGPVSLGFAERPLERDPVLERVAAGPVAPDALSAEPARIAALLLSGHLVTLPDGRIARR